MHREFPSNSAVEFREIFVDFSMPSGDHPRLQCLHIGHRHLLVFVHFVKQILIRAIWHGLGAEIGMRIMAEFFEPSVMFILEGIYEGQEKFEHGTEQE